jgi:hypothetical protein
MSLFTPVLNFLFGKDPDIFDDNGQVVHKHPKKKWDNWQNRYKNDPQFNWRNHTGVRNGEKTNKNTANNPK